MQRRPFILILIALPIAVVCLWVAWRFNADVAQASARAMRGGVTVQTRCGPIEYEAAGEGVPLLMIHGSGGGHDQGMAFGAPFTREGVRVIAVSRFGYLGTPLPADASPEAQGDAHACLLDGYGTYANAEYTAARIAGAKFIGFEQGGHFWVGHNAEVRRAVLDHVLANARQ